MGTAVVAGGVLLGRSLNDTTGKKFAEGEVVRHGNGRGRAPVVSYRADGVEYEIAM